MSPDDMQRFEVDAVYSIGDDPYVTLECPRCPQPIAELETPTTLAELVQRADEHTEVCR